ncbi:MAG TPA: AMED_5909 family protein [Pseudonocardiaceae bacterium]|nr:AMED_5909 family protein [Pseudonocardiaceae bacterium]
MSSLTDDRGSLAESDPPRTLAQAHHVVASYRPPQTASLPEWLAYHQRAAAWYAEVAEIDRGHHHEALYMAQHQGAVAQGIKARIAAQRPAGVEAGE